MVKDAKYKTLIPESFHQQIDELIAYLDFFPFEKVKYCRHCESTNFYATGFFTRPNKQLPQYYCTACQTNFSQLTNTIFLRSWHLEQWGNVGRLYLTGTPVSEIAQLSGMSMKAVRHRFKAINQLMQEKYPTLYHWWHNHTERTDLSFANIQQQQATYFLKWLEEIITRQDYTCLHCNKQLYKGHSQSPRPQFVCYHCNYHFNAISATRFKRMHRIDLWIPYAKALCKGYSNSDIETLINLPNKMAKQWRPVFIQQMQDLKLNELVQWLIWQRKRRYAQITKLNKLTTKG